MLAFKMLPRTLRHYLVVSKPYPVFCNCECEDMVHERLTLRVVARSSKCLQKSNTMITFLEFKNSDIQPTQLSNK